MVLDDESLAALVDAHWSYLESVLENHHVPVWDIDKAKEEYKKGFLEGYKKYGKAFGLGGHTFHYRTAYVHGAKHRKEDEANES